ncbi:response regulator [Cohnella sp. JJ-181]|uniref:response regulator n=1 Tax=Cohnella rhizoplanae TaxID=2974897 RepID=UPI0022FF5A8F|nr:response regulator [Cohnella sp. JJ-181]CAI6044487.1 HTH-type transcriptional activator RhaR [Cohnella sp. JJ-181]
MKLLLVEDEQLIRKGILLKTDWKRCGIEEVEHAEDGSDAVRIAERFRPDILLTDIRMPRMDGIEAARTIRGFCPNVRIIFMSGFSDKEYLKAAISLQSVHYLEKPIRQDELQEALQGAVNLVMHERRSNLGESESQPLIKREIAALLLAPDYPSDRLARLLPLLGRPASDGSACVCAILKWHRPAGAGPSSDAVLLSLEDTAGDAELDCYCLRKDDYHFVIHLCARQERHPAFAARLQDWIERVRTRLPDHPGYHLAIGRQVQGLNRSYDSYVSAVLQLQKSFYRPPNAVLRETDAEERSDAYMFDDERAEAFASALHQGGAEQARQWLENLAREIRQHPHTAVSYTKGVYLQLYQIIRQFGKESGITEFRQDASVGPFAERLHACQRLEDLRALLNGELAALFERLDARKGNSIVRQVMQYVERHYQSRELSLSEIGEFVGVTVPHLCSVFKEGTGVTIKQYVSEYRINRAKALLANRELKLFDIALQVGYADGEYFSKMFKKIAGMQPSEYRKRIVDA